MRSHKGHIPIRTCIGCGAKRSRKELIRLVLDADGLVVRDDSGKGRGRGAYVCPSNSCWKRLEKDKTLKKAFRSGGPVGLHPELDGATWENGNKEPEKHSF